MKLTYRQLLEELQQMPAELLDLNVLVQHPDNGDMYNFRKVSKYGVDYADVDPSINNDQLVLYPDFDYDRE